jgi:enoyl-CoA hydratase
MTVLFEKHGNVGLLKLNRPEALNALNGEMIETLVSMAEELDQDPSIGCLVLAGSDRTFAVGADIKELANKDYLQLASEDYFSIWRRFTELRIAKIAAVSGYALGGGCELAMMCDTIYASVTAQFGQPEVKLGVTPGMGGTQRLTRLIGRAKAMDMILTGRTIAADEAERNGLVARVFSADDLLPETLAIAQSIAKFSTTAIMAAREMIEQVDEMPLSAGIRFERRTYHSLWNTPDLQEGMQAFVEKRPPNFSS